MIGSAEPTQNQIQNELPLIFPISPADDAEEEQR